MKKALKIVLSKSRVLKTLKKRHHNKIIIFNYHRIRAKDSNVLFDDDVFGPDINRFKQEMEWIKKETRVLSEGELIDIIYHNKPITEICSMVTFDDGYRDNYDLAFPILKELKIPAMFFIPTHQLMERQVGWWDIIAYIFKQTTLKRFVFQNIDYELDAPQRICKQFIQAFKSLETSQTETYLVDLSKALKVSLPSLDLQSHELMTCEQLKIMSQSGMTIGSHSHDHSILSKQDTLTLRTQLQKSVDILESILEKKILSIAYPVGGYNHFNQSTKDVSKDLGFKIGFSFLTGINIWGEIDPFNVKRMEIEPEWINLDIPLAFPGYFLRSKQNS